MRQPWVAEFLKNNKLQCKIKCDAFSFAIWHCWIAPWYYIVEKGRLRKSYWPHRSRICFEHGHNHHFLLIYCSENVQPVIHRDLVRIRAWARVSRKPDSTARLLWKPLLAIPEWKWDKGGKPTHNAGTSKEPSERLQDCPPREHKQEVLI